MVAARIINTPARVRALDGSRGSLRDSATASVAGIREVRQAAPRAESCRASATRSTVAAPGNGLKVRGSSDGMTPRSTSRERNCPASG